MKYMGNKTKILPILGEIVAHHSRNSEKISDPFCGSAAVSWYLAMRCDKAIVSGDIQSFAVARAKAVVERTDPVAVEDMIKKWFRRAKHEVDAVAEHFPNHLKSLEPDLDDPCEIKVVVHQSRQFCGMVLPVAFSDFSGEWAISKAYGGHYFSPTQALVLDCLRRNVPKAGVEKQIAIAALVEAASKAAASPGHTAQPFQPTASSAKYIIEAWRRDPWLLVTQATKEIAAHSANVKGAAIVGGYQKTLASLNAGDVVFADPPYSGVHYSRFYHVLEAITRGIEFQPEGVGRYPSLKNRPSSEFSMKSEAQVAAFQLLDVCRQNRLSLVLTFPKTGASNGLLAQDFIDMGAGMFSKVEVNEVSSDFSTLGGNKKHRAARQACEESIIAFLP